MIKLIRVYFFINTIGYLKKKKKNYHKIIYNIVKNIYIHKKNKLINRYISNVYNIFSLFNNSYGMNSGLFNVFFKKFTTY